MSSWIAEERRYDAPSTRRLAFAELREKGETASGRSQRNALGEVGEKTSSIIYIRLYQKRASFQLDPALRSGSFLATSSFFRYFLLILNSICYFYLPLQVYSLIIATAFNVVP